MGGWRALPIVLALSVASAGMAPVARAQSADDAKKAEAIKHFETGVELFKQEAWDAALAEFLRSRELYPTKNALKNAAVCLRELKRFDEALDMYDELLAQFGSKLTPAEKTAVEADQATLDKFVGTLTIQTDTPGARVVVDGRERGVTPLAKPIRVSVGTRAIVITKQGFAPFETKVVVASGDSKVVTAKLASVANTGRLRVTEAKGRAFDVVLDGAVVGKTPWEGTVSAGTHTVALRGPSDQGSVAKSISVLADQDTEVALEAIKLPAELRVSPTPPDADVFIDGKKVGSGRFGGEVAPGEHVVVVSAPWHRDQSTTLTLLPGRTEALSISLDRIRRLFFELKPMFNPLSSPSGSFASPDRGGAGGSGFYGVSLHAGFKLHPHFALEIAGGYLRWVELRSFDNFQISPSFRANLIDEGLVYQGPMAALAGSAHFGDSLPVVLRGIAGLWFVEQRGEGGRLSATEKPHSFASVATSAICPIVGPEARFGVRLSRATTLDLGLLVLLVRCPAHDFGSRTLPTGETIPPIRSNGNGVLWAPTLGFRVEL